jgi:predicted nucleic acid-binding protein
MKKLNIFLDSSALMAGVISETGAAHALLQLGETEDILLTISELVLNETTRSVERKSPDNLEDVQKEIKKAKIKIVKDPSYEEIQANLYLIEDPDDVPVLLAAVKAKVDYLATHDKKTFSQ